MIRLGAKTNLGLLALMSVAFLTGWLGFAYATSPARVSLVAHAASGFAILLLLPWKSMIARRGLTRPRPRRWLSIVFGVLVLASLAAGLAHSSGLLLSVGPITAMDVHVGAAIAAAPFAVWHVAARRIRLRPTDLSRRSFLKGGLVIASGVAAYGAAEVVVRVGGLPGAGRRFTGSYEAGSFQPALMPTSSWMFDPVPKLDPDQWKLRVNGRSVSYRELSAFQDQVTATLDCTGGFYSTQRWTGARLDRLIEDASGASIRVISHTGYDRRFPIEEANQLILATQFGDESLDAGHGFPARLVAPKRRGFWWVKWVVAVEVDDKPYWWQSPYPTQ